MIWDTESMGLLNYFSPCNCPVFSFKFNREESHIFTVSEDSSIKKWRLEQPQLVESIGGFSCSLSNECFDVCEEMGLIAGLAKNNLNDIVLYDMEKKAISNTFKGHTEIINCILISSKNQMLISAGDDNSILIHQLPSCSLVFQFDRVHMSDIRSLTLDSSETHLLTAGHDKRFNLISMRTPGQVLASGRIKQRINKVLYLEETQEVICISDEKQRLYVWNLNLRSDQSSRRRFNRRRLEIREQHKLGRVELATSPEQRRPVQSGPVQKDAVSVHGQSGHVPPFGRRSHWAQKPQAIGQILHF